MGYSFNQKRELVNALRKLRRDKRNKHERLTFQDVQNLVWDLPPTKFERFIDNFQKLLSRLKVHLNSPQMDKKL